MSDDRTIIVENPFHGARDKAPRKGKKPPKLLAVVHQSGCTGCEVCIAGCPVDSIELVPGPVSENPGFNQQVEIDLARCIGCQNCTQDCPWETIMMYSSDDAFTASRRVWIALLLSPDSKKNFPQSTKLAAIVCLIEGHFSSRL